MHRALFPVVLALTATSPSAAQEARPLEWFLPADVAYDASFPEPASVLGWDVGTWHVRHDLLVEWYETVASASPRMQLEVYGQTHEERPLLLATVSSPGNLARIDEICRAHVDFVRNGVETERLPAIAWMGYSVHGNEPSGSNASLLLAYHLAAAQGAEIEAFLENTVVLIDPCLNPDGLSRFAHWANSHRGQNLIGDPSHREHREAWPGGRTNHYWFDLNRDWLLLTHPESRGRLARFHDWMPMVVTDYHEMGTNSTYFFQPGIPSRQNPLTPERNLELTRGIAEFHAKALDEIGSLYYTEESFDDFYYGKGSTYPDINGAIGILFEQASSRGHFQENSFGGIDFPFTIRNQFTTSLSTLRAVAAMRDELSAYQRDFFKNARQEAAEHPVAAYVFGAEEDPGRTASLVELLLRHRIDVHRLGEGVQGEHLGQEIAFSPESAYAVPLDQNQFRLLRALFETRTSWNDNTFYDVSSWTLPLSFDVPYLPIARETFAGALLGEACSLSTEQPGSMPTVEDPVAWVFEWHHYDAPRALQRLLDHDVRARVATKRFRAHIADGARDFDYGTIVVPAGIQDIEKAELRELLSQAAADGLEVFAATSGLTPDGVDLGSASLRELRAPKALMLVGSGVSSYEAGEAWHYLDTRIGLGVSMVEKRSFARLDLSRYTHLLLVNGATGGFGKSETEKLRDWVRAGGILVATKGSAVWTAGALLENADDEDAKKKSGPKDAPDNKGEDKSDNTAEAADDASETSEAEAPSLYEDYEDLRALQRVAGTIFEANLDRTHPLCFGFTRERLPLFRNFTDVLPEGEDPFGAPLRYTDTPLISGFSSEENTKKIAGTPAARAARLGRGAILCLADNPNFRGVWYGTNKLFANAIYFGPALKFTGPILPKDPTDASHDESEEFGHGD